MKWIIMAIFEFYKDNTIASIKNRPEGVRGGFRHQLTDSPLHSSMTELMSF